MKTTIITAALLLVALLPSRGVEAILTDDTSVKAGKGNGASPLITVNATSNGFVKFDFSTLPDDVLPQQIKKATLKLYASNVIKDGFVAVKVQASNWDETTAPFPPSSAALQSKQITKVKKKNFITFDVTSAVQGWLADPDSNFGLALTAADNSINVSFDSKESTAGSQRPELILAIAPPQVVIVANKPGPDQALTPNTLTTITNWEEETDETGAFEPTTGIFTAPIAGTYQITALFIVLGNPLRDGEFLSMYATKNLGDPTVFDRSLAFYRVLLTRDDILPFGGSG